MFADSTITSLPLSPEALQPEIPQHYKEPQTLNPQPLALALLSKAGKILPESSFLDKTLALIVKGH